MRKTMIFFGILLFSIIFNFTFAFATEHGPVEDKWFADKDVHYKKCMVDGCNEHFEEGKHTGGTHENGGRCSICNLIYQTHNKDRDSFSFDEKGHTYKCSYPGCKESFYSEHEKSTEMDWDGKSHWYKCKNEDCTKKYDEEEHYGGEDNDGVCKGCNRKYQGNLDTFKLKDFNSKNIVIKERGDKIQLQVEYYPENLADDKFIFEIEDKNIARVDENGILEGKSKGITKLHIKWNEQEIIYSVYVEINTFEIEVEKNVIVEGEPTQVKVLTKNMPENIKWSLSNPKWGNIDKKGVVILKKGGGYKITINAQYGDLIASTEVRIEHGEIDHREDGSKCLICGEIVEDHKLSEKYRYDEKTHWKICENKKCSGIKFLEGPHTSETSCDICGWHKKGGNGGPGGGNGGDSGGGNNPTPKPPQPQPQPNPGGGWEWRWNDTTHWKVYGGTQRKIKGTEGAHNYSNGVCIYCGKTESQEKCNHIGKGTYLVSLNNGTHEVRCSFCRELIRIENCKQPECDCSKFTKDEVETSLDIPTKVYYVEEDALYEVEDYKQNNPITEIEMDVKSLMPPKFSWTVSTIPGEIFYSDSNNISDDGTIIFWFEGKSFKAKLKDSDRTVLSEEVVIDITLIDEGENTGKREDYETIKLIKNGPPRSYCQVFVDKTGVTKEDNKLQLLIETKYNEFDDLEVKSIGENEFPIYKVKDNKVKIKNENPDIINIGNCNIRQETKNFNGFVGDININPLKKGKAKIIIELTTEYTLNKHKTQEKDRKYEIILEVHDEKLSKPQGGAAGSRPTPLPEIGSNGGENQSGGSSGSAAGGVGMAVVGVIGLLAVALIGAKMFGHH